MPKMKEILVPEGIVPQEAHAIAASFRREANRVRELSAKNRNNKSTLDSTWQGNSKNRFSNDYDPQISQLEEYARALEEKARQIENIRVTVYRKKMVPY
jgi:uncharacterized protein YukE